jgi:beta-lactamase superfamily II metal-dependent hydrolase
MRMHCNTVYVGLGGGSVLQLANREHQQTMSYIIDTPDGKTVVIDGGWGEKYLGLEAQDMYHMLSECGKRVDLWLITHAHPDHFGALRFLLKSQKPFDLDIRDLRFDFPPVQWLKTVENGSYACPVADFLQLVQEASIPVTPLKRGDLISVGDIRVEVLCDAGTYQKYHSINDTSSVLRLSFPKRDLLFLGDIGAERARDLLNECPHDKLRCDIVQMAHHGQGGADRAFYQVVQPKICLYTAPDWLWDNDAGDGFNTGPWQTLLTRQWMEELGAQISLPLAYGDYLLK